MYACLSKYLRPFLLIVSAALLTVACNRIDLAYRNLDVLVPWSLNDYLSMNRQQKTGLSQQLKQQLLICYWMRKKLCFVLLQSQ